MMFGGEEAVAATKAQIDRDFADLEERLGITIPFKERQEAAKWCLTHFLPPAMIGAAWLMLYQEDYLRHRQEIPAPPSCWPYKEDKP